MLQNLPGEGRAPTGCGDRFSLPVLPRPLGRADREPFAVHGSRVVRRYSTAGPFAVSRTLRIKVVLPAGILASTPVASLPELASTGPDRAIAIRRSIALCASRPSPVGPPGSARSALRTGDRCRPRE